MKPEGPATSPKHLLAQTQQAVAFPNPPRSQISVAHAVRRTKLKGQKPIESNPPGCHACRAVLILSVTFSFIELLWDRTLALQASKVFDFQNLRARRINLCDAAYKLKRIALGANTENQARTPRRW